MGQGKNEIGFMLIDSENPDIILDSIHSKADVDHLIEERIGYVKNQEVENLTDENSSSQNDINYANYELIDSVKDEKNIGLTQDLQENVEFVQGVSELTKIIEGEVDDYSIQHSITPPYTENIQDIDIYDMVEMPDIPTRITDDQVIEEFMLEEIDFQGIDKCKIVELQVADEQELEECMQVEAVSDILLPEVYRIDTEIHTGIQLETPIIIAKERCIVQDESKLVQDRTLISGTPIPLQTNAQAHSMAEQQVLLPE